MISGCNTLFLRLFQYLNSGLSEWEEWNKVFLSIITGNRINQMNCINQQIINWINQSLSISYLSRSKRSCMILCWYITGDVKPVTETSSKHPASQPVAWHSYSQCVSPPGQPWRIKALHVPHPYWYIKQQQSLNRSNVTRSEIIAKLKHYVVKPIQ